MTNHAWIAVLDFGSPHTQKIARGVRQLRIYSEILAWHTSASELARRRPAGIVLSDSSVSILDPNAPLCDPQLFELGIPILGIGYGMQMTAQLLGGALEPAAAEVTSIKLSTSDELCAGLPPQWETRLSAGAQVARLPEGFLRLAHSTAYPNAAMVHPQRKIWGLQFNPELPETPYGTDILRNFARQICGCQDDWQSPQIIPASIAAIQSRVGREQVICGLSGGVDSAVVAVLLQRAIGQQLHCIFVDNGLLRADEAAQVQATFAGTFGINLHVVDARARFLADLKGVIDPEQKRKRIGKRFIEVFAAEARRLGKIKFLAQGTIYPDVIESISPLGGAAALVKSHHNVGGLPPDLQFELIEPLRELFKDEVRELGRALGLPDSIIKRQPFPGPGLAVRIIGEVTAARVALLQQAERCLQEEMERYEQRHQLWQYFAVLLPVFSVGVKDAGRTYENVIALRAVTSREGMTAQWARLPADLLARIATRISNEVRGINRVVYDISSKPPATIEWE
ncbi:MAG: glutamine-hydrolyzing GMP synthase [Lentisphaerae bacterium]|nr:glutamine-hydrolyzing GMP synthase [Lentisphaerota bacterium]